MAKKRKLDATGADRAELRALLAAAKADHWDDSRRLVLADWLEENGGEADRARAEIIRLQMDTARGGPDWRMAVEKLRAKHVRDWVPTHRDFFRYFLPPCERGLLHASQGAPFWLRDGPLDEAWDWVESARPATPRAADVPALLESRRLSTVPRLALDRRLSPTSLRTAFARLPSGRVRALSLASYRDAFGEIVPGLRPGLDELDIRMYGDGFDWAAFFRCDGVEGLRGLSLWSTGQDDADLLALAASPRLAGLRRLDIVGRGVTDTGVGALAALPLRRLAVRSGYFGADALARIAEGAGRATLEELRLELLERPGVLPVGFAPPRLRRLSLVRCGLGDADVDLLADGGLMGRLDELDLSGNPGIESMRWPACDGPLTLHLGRCDLGDGAVAVLAAWPGLRRVRCLDLSNNPIGEAGLRALGESAHCPDLEALSVGDDRAAPLGVLLASPLGGRLKWLSLDGASPPRSIRATLARAKLPGLRELRLGWRIWHAMGREALGRLRAAMPWCGIG